MLTLTRFAGKQIQGNVCGAALTMPIVILLDEHGLEFPVRSLPKGIRRRKPGYCYHNSRALAETMPAYLTYVEGIALLRDDGIWRGHAWCIDNEGYVVDVTWNPHGLRYIGVPFLDEEETASAATQDMPPPPSS